MSSFIIFLVIWIILGIASIYLNIHPLLAAFLILITLFILSIKFDDSDSCGYHEYMMLFFLQLIITILMIIFYIISWLVSFL